MLDKAIKIAVEAHSGQTDKGGEPYILHPLRVMMSFEDEDLKIVAVLHDVVEDSNLTIEDLERHGFNKSILNAIDALTKSKEKNYNQYFTLIKWDEMARKVKIADLKDNLRVERLSSFSDADAKRVSKYLSALEYLTTK